MKKVLVTGAFGNVGSLLVKELLQQGYAVVGFDKLSPATKTNAKAFKQTQLEVFWGDITDKSSIEKALDDVSAVIHLAAIFPPLSENHPTLNQAVNVDGTRYLIEAMEASPKAKRLVFASSIGVYGKKQGRLPPPLKSTDPIAPDDYYGKSKAEGEKLIETSQLDWTILRLAPCPPASIKAIASFKDQALFENHPDSRMEVIHPADAALGFANAVSCDACIGKILLLGGGKQNQILYHDMFNIMFTTLGIGPLPREAFKLEEPIDFHGDWLDTSESQALLQYQRYPTQKVYDDFVDSLGILKHGLILLRLLAPLIRPMILKDSFYKLNRSR